MIDPRHAQIGSAPQERHILYMFRQHKRPGLKDEDTAAVCGIGDEEVFRSDSAKGAAADNDHVEVAPSPRDGLRGAIQRFLQSIAEKAPHVVEGE